MKASNIKVMFNRSNVFDPVDKKRFKRNADTPRKDRMAFTHDFPLKIPAKLLNNFHFMTHRYTMTYLMSFKEYSESFIYIYVITNSSYISIPVRPLYAAATYVLPILNSSSTSQCNDKRLYDVHPARMSDDIMELHRMVSAYLFVTSKGCMSIER